MLKNLGAWMVAHPMSRDPAKSISGRQDHDNALTSAMEREVTEPWDYIDKIKYFSCPDSERPVSFKVKRLPVKQGEIPLRKKS